MHIHPRPSRLLVVAVPAALLSAALLGPISGHDPAAGGTSAGPGGVPGEAVAPSPAVAVTTLPPGPPPLDPAAVLGRVGESPSPRPLPELTGYVWPLPHGRVTQPFGRSAGNAILAEGVETHDGVDLATFCGDRIVAAHDGVVLAAGRDYLSAIGWRGDIAPYRHWLDVHAAWVDLPITVILDDGDTYRTIYAHFSRIVVSVGQHVRAGQLLGYEGRTGHATGCHLHFGLFSPLEPATWAVVPDIMRKYDLPPAETARVDPLLVLPPRSPRPAPGTVRRLDPPGGSEPL